MGDRDGGGGAAESYARKRQYDYNAVRYGVALLLASEAFVQEADRRESGFNVLDVAGNASACLFFSLPAICASQVTGSTLPLDSGTC